MSLVDETYFAHLRSLDGPTKLRRTFSLYRSLREMTVRELKRRSPTLCEREMAFKVAERMYGSDERMIRLIEKARQYART